MVQKRPIRVGSFTLGFTLLGVGVALLAHNFGKAPAWGELWRLWPVLPLLLGVEFLVRQQLARGQEDPPTIRLDGLSLLLAIFILLSGIAYTVVPAGLVNVQDLVGLWHPYEYQTQVTREVTDLTGVEQFIVTNRMGSVRLEGTDSDRVQVVATIRTSGASKEEAEALARDVEILLSGSPQLRLESRIPPISSGRSSRATVSYEVSVPRKLVTSADVSFGSLDAHGITASTLTVRNGNLDASALEGDVRIGSSFGSVSVREVAGSLTVDAGNGQVEVDRVSGKVTVRNKFGSLQLTDLGGPVDVMTSQGNVDIVTSQPVGGDWSLTNRFGNINVTVPGDSSLQVTALTHSGQLSMPDWVSVSRDANQASASGVLGKGEHVLKLQTTNGNVVLTTN
ncbi:MAG: DUF4097 family beta strand repeat-containing protein [Bacillota bacterium]